MSNTKADMKRSEQKERFRKGVSEFAIELLNLMKRHGVTLELGQFKLRGDSFTLEG